MRFVLGLEGVGSLEGETAKLRMDEAWAWKRKVSLKVTFGELFVEEGGEKVAVKPCRTRSYEPVMICIDTDEATASSVTSRFRLPVVGAGFVLADMVRCCAGLFNFSVWRQKCFRIICRSSARDNSRSVTITTIPSASPNVCRDIITTSKPLLSLASFCQTLHDGGSQHCHFLGHR